MRSWGDEGRRSAVSCCKTTACALARRGRHCMTRRPRRRDPADDPRDLSFHTERHRTAHNGRDYDKRKQVPGHGWAPRTLEPRLVAEPVGYFGSPPALGLVRSDGRGVQLRQGIQDPRPERGDCGSARRDDQLAGLVAGRLRSLRRALHPDGLAQRRHVPDRRWPRRGGRRPAAVRAAKQLARQRQPRQGAPAALADQAEIRSENFLGGPHGSGGQRRARVRWASRPSVSAAAAPTPGSPKSSTGVQRGRG